MRHPVAALLFLALVPAVLSFGWHAASGRLPVPQAAVPRVQVKEADRWQDVVWIDARGREAYGREHVPGALPLDEDEWSDALPEVLDAWQPGSRVVIYCSSESCAASESVARRLMEETGWPDIFVLEGGWEAWQAQGR